MKSLSDRHGQQNGRLISMTRNRARNARKSAEWPRSHAPRLSLPNRMYRSFSTRCTGSEPFTLHATKPLILGKTDRVGSRGSRPVAPIILTHFKYDIVRISRYF